MFQSTHPHGVRRAMVSELGMLDAVSIHAPTWGATSILLSVYSLDFLFQSTHPHGVRPHIQQKAEYHIAKVYNLRRKTKRIILKEIKAKK